MAELNWKVEGGAAGEEDRKGEVVAVTAFKIYSGTVWQCTPKVSALEAEEGISEVHDHPQLHNKLKVSPGYMRFFFSFL